MTPLRRAAKALIDRAESLSPETQQELADILDTMTMMSDHAVQAASEQASVSVGGLAFSFSPKKALAFLTRIAPPLRVKR